jgi:hypothetical protein
VTDDLRINSDEMACNRGLKYYSMIIILHHLQVGIEQLDQSGVHHTSTAVEISPVVRLNDVKYVVQWWHHDISPKHVPLSNDGAVHNFGLDCSPIFHKSLTDPAGWTPSRHDSTKRSNKNFQRKIFQKNILVRITQIWQNNSSKRTSKIISTKSKKFQHGRYMHLIFQK